MSFRSLAPIHVLTLMFAVSTCSAGFPEGPMLHPGHPIQILQSSGNWIRHLQFTVSTSEGDFEVKQISLSELQFYDSFSQPTVKAIKSLGSSRIELFGNAGNWLGTLFSKKGAEGHKNYLSYEDSNRDEVYQAFEEKLDGKRVLQFREVISPHESEDVLSLIDLSQGLTHRFEIRSLRPNRINLNLVIARGIFDALRSYRRQNAVGAALAGSLAAVAGYHIVKKGYSGNIASLSSQPESAQSVHDQQEAVSPRQSSDDEEKENTGTFNSQGFSSGFHSGWMRYRQSARSYQQKKEEDEKEIGSGSRYGRTSPSRSIGFDAEIQNLGLTKVVSFQVGSSFYSGSILSISDNKKLRVYTNAGQSFDLDKKNVSKKVQLTTLGVNQADVTYVQNGQRRFGTVLNAFDNKKLEIQSLDLFGRPMIDWQDASQVSAMQPLSTLQDEKGNTLTREVTYLDYGVRHTGFIKMAYEGGHLQMSQSATSKDVFWKLASQVSSEVPLSEFGLTQTVLLKEGFDDIVGQIRNAFSNQMLKISVTNGYAQQRIVWRKVSEVTPEETLSGLQTVSYRNSHGKIETKYATRKFANGAFEISSVGIGTGVKLIEKKQVVNLVKPRDLGLTTRVMYQDQGIFKVGDITNAFKEGDIEFSVENFFGRTQTIRKKASEVYPKVSVSSLKDAHGRTLTESVSYPDLHGKKVAAKILHAYQNGYVELPQKITPSLVYADDLRPASEVSSELSLSELESALGITREISYFSYFPIGGPKTGQVLRAFADGFLETTFGWMGAHVVGKEVSVSFDQPVVSYLGRDGSTLKGSVLREFSNGVVEVRDQWGNKVVLEKRDVFVKFEPNDLGLTQDVAFTDEKGVHHVGKFVQALSPSKVEISTRGPDDFAEVRIWKQASDLGTEVPLSQLKLSSSITFLDKHNQRRIGRVRRAFSNQLVHIDYGPSHVYQIILPRASVVAELPKAQWIFTYTVLVVDSASGKKFLALLTHEYADGTVAVREHAEEKIFPKSSVFSEIKLDPSMKTSVKFKFPSDPHSVYLGTITNAFSNGYYEVICYSHGSLKTAFLRSDQFISDHNGDNKSSSSSSKSEPNQLEIPFEKRVFPKGSTDEEKAEIEAVRVQYDQLMKVGKYLNDRINQVMPELRRKNILRTVDATDFTQEEVNEIILHVAKMVLSSNDFNSLRSPAHTLNKLSLAFHVDKVKHYAGKKDEENHSITTRIFNFVWSLGTYYKDPKQLVRDKDLRERIELYRRGSR